MFLLVELCKVMTAIPLHQEKYIMMCEMLLSEYLERCFKEFRSTRLKGTKWYIFAHSCRRSTIERTRLESPRERHMDIFKGAQCAPRQDASPGHALGCPVGVPIAEQEASRRLRRRDE